MNLQNEFFWKVSLPCHTPTGCHFYAWKSKFVKIKEVVGQGKSPLIFFFCIFLNLSFYMTTHQCHRLNNSLTHPCVRLREFAQQFNNLNNKTLRKTTRSFVLKDLERVVGSAVLIK